MSGGLASLVASANAKLSSSKLMWGVAAIVASLGSRFVIGDLTPGQQGVMTNKVVRRVVVFAMVFLPTRDVMLSVCLTVVVLVMLDGLLNERSRFCILPMCSSSSSSSSSSIVPVAHHMLSMATAVRPRPVATAGGHDSLSTGGEDMIDALLA